MRGRMHTALWCATLLLTVPLARPSAANQLLSDPAQLPPRGPDAQTAAPTAELSTDLPPGWVLVRDVTATELAEEPHAHLVAARADAQAGRSRAAAAQLRRPAAYMRSEEYRTDPATRRGLVVARAELEALITALSRRAPLAPGELESAFARTEIALAQERAVSAGEAWERQDAEQAGYELDAAADGLVRATEWRTDQAGAPLLTAARDGQQIAERLVHGSGTSSREVVETLDALEQAIGQVRDHLGASPAPGNATSAGADGARALPRDQPKPVPAARTRYVAQEADFTVFSG